MKTGPTNGHLKSLVGELSSKGSKEECKLWTRLAKDLNRSTRQRREVNLSRLARFTKKGETVVVPGKVLGSGELNHDLTVAAWAFSSSARASIEKANGKCVSIEDLMQSPVKGKKIRILG